MTADPTHGVLYRMRDASGRLLYVGITATVEDRLRAHRGDKPWWPAIATIELEHFDCRQALEEAEVAAIRAENPAFNLVRYEWRSTTRGTADAGDQFAPPRVPTIRLNDGLWHTLGLAAEIDSRSRPRQLSYFAGWYIGAYQDAQLERPPASALRGNRARQLRQVGQGRARQVATVDVDRWEQFGRAAHSVGTSRELVVASYVRWFFRVPDVDRPRRPSRD